MQIQYGTRAAPSPTGATAAPPRQTVAMQLEDHHNRIEALERNLAEATENLRRCLGRVGNLECECNSPVPGELEPLAEGPCDESVRL